MGGGPGVGWIGVLHDWWQRWHEHDSIRPSRLRRDRPEKKSAGGVASNLTFLFASGLVLGKKNHTHTGMFQASFCFQIFLPVRGGRARSWLLKWSGTDAVCRFLRDGKQTQLQCFKFLRQLLGWVGGGRPFFANCILWNVEMKFFIFFCPAASWLQLPVQRCRRSSLVKRSRSERIRQRGLSTKSQCWLPVLQQLLHLWMGILGVSSTIQSPAISKWQLSGPLLRLVITLSAYSFRRGGDFILPDTLQEVPIDVLSSSECRSYWGGTIPDYDSVFCVYDVAGGNSGDTGGCNVSQHINNQKCLGNMLTERKRKDCDRATWFVQGDSGGPLSCQNPSGSWDVIGAASFVATGCITSYPTGYGNLQDTWDFIQGETGIEPSSWKAK